MDKFRYEYDTSMDWSCGCDVFTDYYTVFHDNERYSSLIAQSLCNTDRKELVILITDCPGLDSIDRFEVVEGFLPILFQSYHIEDFEKISYKTWCPPSHLKDHCDMCISGDYYIDLFKFAEGRYM